MKKLLLLTAIMLVLLFPVMANGEKEFVKILVVGGLDGEKLVYTSPCGVCRQYMIELNKNITVVTTNFTEDGVIFKESTPVELLADTFILEDQINNNK